MAELVRVGMGTVEQTTDSVNPEEYELDLAPNEQLDALSQRSNKDGTVNVPILDWDKYNEDYVEVFFRRPDGSVESERMAWPQHATDERSRFVRLVKETPYTIATADRLCEDEDVWVRADPDDWSLHLRRPMSARERLYERLPELEVSLWELFVMVSWVSVMVGLTVVMLVMLL